MTHLDRFKEDLKWIWNLGMPMPLIQVILLLIGLLGILYQFSIKDVVEQYKPPVEKAAPKIEYAPIVTHLGGLLIDGDTSAFASKYNQELLQRAIDRGGSIELGRSSTIYLDTTIIGGVDLHGNGSKIFIGQGRGFFNSRGIRDLEVRPGGQAVKAPD